MIYLKLLPGFGAILLTVFMFPVIRRIISHVADKRIETYQNDLLAKHSEEVQDIYRKMRGWRHDYHNHIQTMKAHLAMDQLNELHDYLNMLDEDLNTVDTVIKTGNIRLDAILNSKLSFMASRKIHINAKAQVPERLKVNDIDLCVIIGNLLNNALESCERITDEKKRFIRIYIGVLKQQLYISVTNSADAAVKKFGHGQYHSIRGEGHGFGLKRIDSLVEKYGGYLNRQSEPEVFATEIMLPL